MTEAEAIDKIIDSLDGNHNGSVSVYSYCGNEATINVSDEDGNEIRFKVTIQKF